jgi:hypothetical protein
MILPWQAKRLWASLPQVNCFVYSILSAVLTVSKLFWVFGKSCGGREDVVLDRTPEPLRRAMAPDLKNVWLMRVATRISHTTEPRMRKVSS